VSDNAWTTIAPATVGPVAAGASATLPVTVTVPAGAAAGASDTATVKVTSQGDGTRFAQSVLTTTCRLYRVFLPLVLRNYRP